VCVDASHEGVAILVVGHSKLRVGPSDSGVDFVVKETDSTRCLSSVSVMISSKRTSIGLRISPNRNSIRSKISRKLDSILGLGLGW
jgi:hypothetical protein